MVGKMLEEIFFSHLTPSTGGSDPLDWVSDPLDWVLWKKRRRRRARWLAVAAAPTDQRPT